jgi:predicted homoserine dehydrogenase-like protein
MALLARLADRGAERGDAAVAVVGAGFMARALVRQVALTAGMRVAVIVARRPEAGVEACRTAGLGEPLVADDAAVLAQAVAQKVPAVTRDPAAASELEEIDVVVEATGALEYGAQVILGALGAGKDVVSLNAELDATIGHLLHAEAERAGAVYSIADGDQPGVLMRQIDFVSGLGLELVAAVNCKRNLDVHQNPDDSRPYAERDGTSVSMTTAFGDGTKMQIENAVVANLTGLVPDRRGMHGVETTLDRALEDVTSVLSRRGVVEYTVGGDFGGGVFVIGRTEDAGVRSYLAYSKLGEGPDFLFFRPYHLMHFEVPLTIAQAVLDRRPLGRPVGLPVAEVVAVAKRDLRPGEELDGIGGFCCYGHVDTAERAAGYLPIGLAAHARVVEAVPADQPVPLAAVELEEESELFRLRARYEALASARS